ncbi:MAG: hypothetical protein M1820_007305 [Bogoriella megaspora]|nr:MAG: hypothetical protein M1820_007305 [Bogoriella megaspora]
MNSERQSYFVPGYGISRYVIQSQIRYYCGPGAFARPYTLHVSSVKLQTALALRNTLITWQGRDGFLVTSSGPPLTKEQLEDLRQDSKEYEEQQAARVNEGTDDPNQPVVVEQSQHSRQSGSR